MSRKNRRLGAFVLFSILGFGKLWLWHEGRSNQFGLYLGVAFVIYAAWCCSGHCQTPASAIERWPAGDRPRI